MSYIGRVEQKASEIRRFNVAGSTSDTHTLTWTAPSEQSLIITINGVKQQEDAYSVSGTTLTLTSALVSTDKMEVVGILDIGEQTIPGDNSVTTAKIQDDAVTADKLANSINTEIAANTAKVTNATHTGDVTGATALTIAAGAVDIPMLSATGTASATTFLRGDNAWAEAGGGKVLQLQSAELAGTTGTTESTSYIDTGLNVSITPTAATSKIVVFVWTLVYSVTSTTAQYSAQIIEDGSSTVLCEFVNTGISGGTTHQGQISMGGVFSCSDTSALTFKTQMHKRSNSGTLYYLGYETGSKHTIIAVEVAA